MVKGLFPDKKHPTHSGKKIYFGLTGTAQKETADAIRHIVSAFHRTDEIKGQAVTLEHDANNEHDPFAIQVKWKDIMIGWVPRYQCPKCESRLFEDDIQRETCNTCGAHVVGDDLLLNKKVLSYLEKEKIKVAEIAWAAAHQGKNPGAAVRIYVEE